jgi:arylsulfatase A-like enzyme
MFGGMSDHTKVPVKDRLPDGSLSQSRVSDQFSSEMFADSAIEFLKTRDRDRPFFAYVAFTAPHDPRQPPQEYRDRYYSKLPPLPSNFLPQLPFDNGMMNGGRDENLAAWPRTEAIIRDQLAEYYGLITHMDDQIGRILEALEQSGDADNTLIVFTADNGLAMGSHGLLGKQSVYEHSMKTPLIVVGPNVPAGQSSSAFTYLLDLFPTICDVLKVSPPENLAGSSLRAIWTGEKKEIRDSLFLPYIDIQRAVRDDRWKLIAYPKIEYLQLFDLQSDPDELQNLAAQPEHADDLRRMQQLMARWQAETGDQLKVPVESREPEAIDLTGKPRDPDQWQPRWIVEKYFRK